MEVLPSADQSPDSTASSLNGARVLFLTWDGPAQTYLESLYLPILVRLGARVRILQFGWGAEDEAHRVAAATNRLGIPFERFKVARRPTVILGVTGTLGAGAFRLARLLREVDAVLARGPLPAGLVAAARALGARTRLVFDADGLPADERLEFGGWHASDLRYRALRELELSGLRGANAVVTRTTSAAQILRARLGPSLPETRLFVVPNGSDPSRFRLADDSTRRATRARHGIGTDAPWVICSGSIGPQYLVEQVFQFFDAVRSLRPDARLHVLTRMHDEADAALRAASVDRTGITIASATPDEVATQLAAADLGAALRRATFSQQAVSPIKVGEYLLSGLPLLLTSGVGDLDATIDDRVALRLDVTGAASLTHAARRFVHEWLPRRAELSVVARSLGLSRFTVATCAAGYARAVASALDEGPR